MTRCNLTDEVKLARARPWSCYVLDQTYGFDGTSRHVGGGGARATVRCALGARSDTSKAPVWTTGRPRPRGEHRLTDKTQWRASPHLDAPAHVTGEIDREPPCPATRRSQPAHHPVKAHSAHCSVLVTRDIQYCSIAQSSMFVSDVQHVRVRAVQRRPRQARRRVHLYRLYCSSQLTGWQICRARQLTDEAS
jgi:hypothetical protein